MWIPTSGATISTNPSGTRGTSEELEVTAEKEDIVVNAVVFMEVSHYLIKNPGAVKGKEKVEKLLEYP